eukprot:scaffold73238_cov31-Tisochrysis_lutea.AAC.4
MSYQPCHHSGGRLPDDEQRKKEVATARANMAHPISCSERLLEFYTNELAPRNMGLEIVVADLYKARTTPAR